LISLVLVMMNDYVGDDGFCVDILYLINCGQGTYKASNASLLGFECECNPGWTTIQIGPLTFPSCVIPNCESLYHYKYAYCRYEVTLRIVNTSIYACLYINAQVWAFVWGTLAICLQRNGNCKANAQKIIKLINRFSQFYLS
jgi:hypothetical protein